ncbi:MAG: hypothetical protein EKK53_14910 [Burkholderiales bacterium]|nr:MAG: hypothetical protein EKK53_14910 [Burkholderiales bacterium]
MLRTRPQGLALLGGAKGGKTKYLNRPTFAIDVLAVRLFGCLRLSPSKPPRSAATQGARAARFNN